MVCLPRYIVTNIDLMSCLHEKEVDLMEMCALEVRLLMFIVMKLWR